MHIFYECNVHVYAVIERNEKIKSIYILAFKYMKKNTRENYVLIALVEGLRVAHPELTD